MITLTTDFGGDYYVGEMKGAIFSIDENARVVDITHNIKKHSVAEAAFVLSRVWRHFPKGTVHVGVVDPGVGSGRRAAAIETEHCFFVGPDNGIFTLALREQKTRKIVEIEQSRASKTFHGRDLFAPAAAMISKGIGLKDIGRAIETLTELKIESDSVLYTDSFGNVITGIDKKFTAGDEVAVDANGKIIKLKFVETFGDVPKGGLCVLRGSHGFLEIDMNRGNAAERLKVKTGDKITIGKC